MVDVAPSLPAPAIDSAGGRRHKLLASPVLRLVATRLAWLLITLFVVSVLIFAATQALPGDTARAILGRNATPDRLGPMRERLGLNRPLLDQYLSWLGGVLRGDLGTSLASGNADGRSVSEVISPKVAHSLWLLLTTAIVSVPLAIGFALATAARPNGLLDRIVNVVSLGIIALPEFVVGIGVVVLLSTGVFHLFPAVSVIYGDASVISDPKVLVLPTITLTILVLPYLLRLVRASAIEAMESEYVRAARLRGIGGPRLLVRHVLPNVAAPMLQAIVLVLVYLLGGVVIVETVFNYPGMGLALVEAVRLRDLPVIQALALAIAAFYLILTAAADLMTIALTPRMRSARR